MRRARRVVGGAGDARRSVSLIGSAFYAPRPRLRGHAITGDSQGGEKTEG